MQLEIAGSHASRRVKERYKKKTRYFDWTRGGDSYQKEQFLTSKSRFYIIVMTNNTHELER